MSEIIHLTILAGEAGICRLTPGSEIPSWAIQTGFYSITRTTDELSIICPVETIPDGVACETGWRVIKLEGPFEFSEIGILARILEPLAGARISILALSTYDTDYVLVKDDKLARARGVLDSAGFIFTNGIGM